jgi:hypothetical protein
MGGCTNCSGKADCDDHKGVMMGAVEAALAAIYPTRTWGEPDDVALRPPEDDDLAALADELASVLTAPTFVRTGGDTDACDYIYVLCMGRVPCVAQVRDHGVPAPAEWDGHDELIRELYLRVCISQRAPVAAVQQVALELHRDPRGGWLVHERPRAGVYDAPLLPRMQKLVAILPAYGLEHVDFGDIAHAPPGFAAGAWQALYGGEPAIANYLFYAQPTTMVTTAAIADRS